MCFSRITGKFNFICCVGLSLVIAMFCLGETVQGAVLQLKPQATVQGSMIHLGEVADVYDQNPNNVVQLQKLVLGPAPIGGRKIQITIQDVRSRLKANNVNLLAVELRGSTVVEVASINRSNMIQQTAFTTPQQLVDQRKYERSSKALKQAVHRYLKKQGMKAPLEGLTLKIGAADTTYVRATHQNAYHVQGGQAPWEGYQQLQVTVSDSQNKMKAIWVGVQIQSGPKVLVPKYNIPRGRSLTANDFELVTAEQTNGLVLGSFEEIEGQQAAQNLRAGQQIRATQVKPMVLVKRNAVVKVRSQIGGISVFSHFKSKDEGSLGELIQVESLRKTQGRPQLLEVKVVGVNEAMVQPKMSSASINTQTRKSVIQ